jgi:hypothetical protein
MREQCTFIHCSDAQRHQALPVRASKKERHCFPEWENSPSCKTQGVPHRDYNTSVEKGEGCKVPQEVNAMSFSRAFQQVTDGRKKRGVHDRSLCSHLWQCVEELRCPPSDSGDCALCDLAQQCEVVWRGSQLSTHLGRATGDGAGLFSLSFGSISPTDSLLLCSHPRPPRCLFASSLAVTVPRLAGGALLSNLLAACPSSYPLVYQV